MLQLAAAFSSKQIWFGVLYNHCVVCQGSGGAADILAEAISKRLKGDIDPEAHTRYVVYRKTIRKAMQPSPSSALLLWERLTLGRARHLAMQEFLTSHAG